MKYTLFSLAALLALSVTACKKDDNPNRSQLIVGTWKPSFDAQDENNNKTLDASERQALPDSVTQSAFYKFDAGGTGNFGYRGNSISFAWALYNGDQQLILKSGVSADTLKIHTLSSSELIFEETDNNDYYWIGLKK